MTSWRTGASSKDKTHCPSEENFIPTGKGRFCHLVCETGTVWVWFKRPLHALAYCLCETQCLVLNFPLGVSWKKWDDRSQNHWPCWTHREQEASVAVKQAQLFFLSLSLFSTAKTPVSSQYSRFAGVLLHGPCQNCIQKTLVKLSAI